MLSQDAASRAWPRSRHGCSALWLGPGGAQLFDATGGGRAARRASPRAGITKKS